MPRVRIKVAAVWAGVNSFCY